MKIGDKVEILNCIAQLQPKIYLDKNIGLIKKTRRQFGTITNINGGYISVRPKNRKWETECYECELKVISKEKFKKAKNYRRD